MKTALKVLATIGFAIGFVAAFFLASLMVYVALGLMDGESWKDLIVGVPKILFGLSFLVMLGKTELVSESIDWIMDLFCPKQAIAIDDKPKKAVEWG